MWYIVTLYTTLWIFHFCKVLQMKSWFWFWATHKYEVSDYTKGRPTMLENCGNWHSIEEKNGLFLSSLSDAEIGIWDLNLMSRGIYQLGIHLSEGLERMLWLFSNVASYAMVQHSMVNWLITARLVYSVSPKTKEYKRHDPPIHELSIFQWN